MKGWLPTGSAERAAVRLTADLLACAPGDQLDALALTVRLWCYHREQQRTVPAAGAPTFAYLDRRREGQGVTMGRHQRDADEAGWLAIHEGWSGKVGSHHGGFLHTADATVKGNSGVGRKGKGQLPVTAKQIRAAKKIVAAERKTAKTEMKAAGKAGKK